MDITPTHTLTPWDNGGYLHSDLTVAGVPLSANIVTHRKIEQVLSPSTHTHTHTDTQCLWSAEVVIVVRCFNVNMDTPPTQT